MVFSGRSANVCVSASACEMHCVTCGTIYNLSSIGFKIEKEALVSTITKYPALAIGVAFAKAKASGVRAVREDLVHGVAHGLRCVLCGGRGRREV